MANTCIGWQAAAASS
jgi:hypothetical protein